MDRLFTPWRYAYVTGPKTDGECVLCAIGAAAPEQDASLFVLRRASRHYLVLNIYPYNPGHLMVVPYRHVGRLSDLDTEARGELLDLAASAERALERVYRAEGLNVGLNLGKCAGAGLDGHLHLHVVPRWGGDVNFMTVTGETRVIPEDLAETWRKLSENL